MTLLADGPVIQIATQTALENGKFSYRAEMPDAVRTICQKGMRCSRSLMMGYVNPMLAYGIENFVNAAKMAGASGLIIPDLPPEEAGAFAEACERVGLALVFFLSLQPAT